MINGLSHITIAVSNLQRSLDFYVRILGIKPEVEWDNGAYLSAGNLWICLTLDEVSPSTDYSHIAFSIESEYFESYSSRLRSQDIKIWKENSSEGESLYILDPDGNKLEIHAGNLNSRLDSLRTAPYKGLKWY